MLTHNDERLLQEKGISPERLEEQLSAFRNGFPYLTIRSAAAIGNGILRLNDTAIKSYTDEWTTICKGIVRS